MRRHGCCHSVMAAAAVLASWTGAAFGQGAVIDSAFTYQGVLESDGVRYSGPATVRYRVFGAATGGSALVGPVERSVTVTDGLFTTTVDVGFSEIGRLPRYLEMEVNTGSGFVTLSPRQLISPAPLAGVAWRALTTDLIMSNRAPSQKLVASQQVESASLNSNTGWQTFLGAADSLTRLAVVTRSGFGGGGATLRIYAGAGTGGTLLHEQGVWLALNGETVIDLVPAVPMTAGQTYTWQLTSSEAVSLGLAFGTGDPLPSFPSSIPGPSDFVFRAYSGREGSTLIAGDRVGIGLGQPTANLHVRGNAIQRTAEIASAEGNGAWLRLAALGLGGRTWALASAGGSSPLGAGNFAIVNTSTGTPALTIDANNDVGIGTSSPNTPLHLDGGTDANYQGGGLLQIGPTSGLNIVMDGNEILARNNGGEFPLYLNAPGGGVVVGGTVAASATVHVQAGGNLSAGGTPHLMLGAASGIHMELDNNEIQVFANTSTTTLFLNSSGGSVVIGNTASPSGNAILQVAGNAAKPLGGSWASLSDARAKADISPMRGTLDRLLRLHGYTFRYTDEALALGGGLPGMQLGLMAQEVREVFPDWVAPDDHGRLTVTERATTALMVEALRELRTEKDAQIAERDAEIAELRARLERLERAIDQRGTP